MKRIFFLRVAVVGAMAVVFLAEFSSAWANDSTAVDEGGEIVLKKSEHVVMQSEELTISPSLVSVAYLFKNTGTKDITTYVAFPIRTDDEFGEDAHVDRDEKATSDLASEKIDSFAFKLLVDEVERSPEVKVQTTHAHREVIFYWQQIFPAGKVVSIKHVYRPRGGFIFPSEEYWDEIAQEYCIDAKSLKSVKKSLRERVGEASQVHYILKTGANWAGPIAKFRLTIRKEPPYQMVFLCADGVRRQDSQTFVVEKTNFVPRSDLKIIFLRFGLKTGLR
jgi:Domain of unknown function (DUF4424)